MAVDCKDLTKKIQMFGFGIPGQGFYSLNIPEAKVKVIATSGPLTILEGDAIEEKVDRELKHLVKEGWDFRVRRMDKQEYLVVFPDRNSLDTFTKLSGFEMSLYGLKGKLEKSSIEPVTSSVLHTTWIKIHNVPDFAREVDAVKEITNLVAEPLVVDELSLIKVGPIRVQGRCRNPQAIRGTIEIFFNGVGVLVKFEVEEPQGGIKGGKGGPPGNGKPDDSQNRDTDKGFKGDKSRRGQNKSDRIERVD
jgi:hypothetical protein